MTARAAEPAAVAALALVVTLVAAAPVLRAPSERIFGMEIVGRHYDPFTVMEQFEQPVRWTAFLQPLTDVPGAWLARSVGAVASYNIVVLASFPLTAATTYLLARHFSIAGVAATGAALAVAFSPFHIAQAAYHPHIAQVQWLPLYLLALWRCLDRPTWAAAAWLVSAAAAMALSNAYGGFIGAVITPVAMVAHWWFIKRCEPGSVRRLMVTTAALGVAAAGIAAYAWLAGGTAVARTVASDFAPADSVRYGASWWSYLVPPIAHPLLGDLVHRTGRTIAPEPGLLEQQVFIGWGLIALSGVAVATWIRQRRPGPAVGAVPVLAVVAVVALLCSLSPRGVMSALTTSLPGVAFHELLPMFRSYARFGSIVQLMIALLAAIGAVRLWQSRARGARMTGAALVMLAATEYAVWPPALWRDVLPTTAHRWAAQQPASLRVLDCYPHTRESQSVQWLTGGRVLLRPRTLTDCREPGAIATLSAAGFTHLLVRQHTPEAQWLDRPWPPPGLRVAARFGDAGVFAVTAMPSRIRTVAAQAFYPAEFDEAWTWRWMGRESSWTVINGTDRALMASVDLEASAFHEPRRLIVLLDGVEVQDLLIDTARASRRIGPFALRPGEHSLGFRAAAPPTVADDRLHNGDRRPLSFAFGDWRWSADGDSP